MIAAVPRLRRYSNWSAARTIVVVNFFLIAAGLLLDKVGGSSADLALRSLGLDKVVALSLQLWLASSTLLATGFFLSSLYRLRRAGSNSTHVRGSLMVDGALLLAWWLAVVVACAYAFMLGMAG